MKEGRAPCFKGGFTGSRMIGIRRSIQEKTEKEKL